MSKIKIISKQIFEDHVENIEEEHDGDINILTNGFELNYDGKSIELLDDMLCVKQDKMFMKIEEGKSNLSKIMTPYGEIELTTNGKKIEWTREPFHLTIRYSIAFGKMKEYLNELQIFIY